MLIRSAVSKKRFKDYRKFISSAQYRRVVRLARQFAGRRIIHINATPIGGGVAEILQSLVPLQRSLGVDARWYHIKAHKRFFSITKKIHDSLQGSGAVLTKKEKAYFLDINEALAKEAAALKPDVLIVHDPQPIGVANCCGGIPTVLRIHPDLSRPNPDTMRFLFPFFKRYDAVIFSMREYVPRTLGNSRTFIVSPAIDPLSPKHAPLTKRRINRVLRLIGADPARPLIAQISRFDLWKDPIGVIGAFWEAEKHIPGLQLALVGVLEAQDDPTAVKIFKHVQRAAKADPNIFLIMALDHVPVSNDVLVNAFQRAANPVLQKSLREGFGLTVTEAMWKGRVVIGGNVGGIKDQIRDGKNGYLVESSEEAAARIVEVFRNKTRARAMGKRAKETVRKRYLMPRLLEDHLKIYRSVL